MMTRNLIYTTIFKTNSIKYIETKMVKYYILSLVFICFFFSALGQSAKIKPVIIDTDCSADDYRALCMLLAIEEIDILAITTAANAPVSMEKKSDNFINSALNEGKFFDKKIEDKQKAVGIIAKQLRNANEQVTIVCLGSLTNIAKVLQKHQALKSKIKQIIWCRDFGRDFSVRFFNKNSDSSVLETNCTINIVANLNEELQFDDTLLQEVGKIATPFAERVYRFMQEKAMQKHDKMQFVKISDEIGVVFFLYPELFDMQPDSENPYVSKSVGFNKEVIKENILKILAQKYTIEKNIAFEKFPVDPVLYRYDVREIADSTIRKYGIEEWKICVLTNEIHQHLGIYSLVGAKMGLKARELLHAELDRIKVHSYAGDKPPMSCLLDGLQISTGATLGLGMIAQIFDSVPLPKAVFEYQDAEVALTLKPKYKKQVANDISRSIVQCGNLTNGYWKLIRRLSIKYWAEWDRNEIFTIEWIKKPHSAD